MNKVIAMLEKEEVNEIELYFERYNSLKEFSLVFESEDIFNKNCSMYEKLISDLSETRSKFNSWWTKIIEKYKLEKYNREEMIVDFEKHEITISN